MIAKLLSLLTPEKSQESESAALPLATALLLVEAGMMDGAVGPEEQETIVRLLGKRFSLDSAAAQALADQAMVKVEENVELFSHTKLVKDALSYEERLDIIEMLWEVVYADGHLHDFEANLMRRVTRLIYVDDKDSGLARKRVLERLGLS